MHGKSNKINTNPKAVQALTAKEKEALRIFLQNTATPERFAAAQTAARLAGSTSLRSRPGFKRSPSDAGTGSSRGARLDMGHRIRSRSRLAAGRRDDPILPMSVTRTSAPEGFEMTAHVQHHQNMGSFIAAVSPLKENFSWTGPSLHQFDEIRGTHHVTHVAGREYLDDVKVGPIVSGNWPTGGVLGQYPLDPVGLCARTAYFAKLFEQNKLHSLRVRYVPSVPMTEPGAIAMSFSNDVFTENWQVGLASVSIQSSKEAFTSSPVTQSFELEIEPQHAVRVMFDEDRGNARFTTAGMVTVLSLSDLNTVLPATAKTYGSLFVEYHYEFLSPELDQTVSLIQNAVLNVTLNGVTTVVIDNDVVFRVAAVPGVNCPIINPNTLPTSISTLDLPEYVYVGFLRDAAVDPTWDVILEDDSTRYVFQRGHPVYLRFISASNGVTYAVPFGSYGRARDADPNLGAAGDPTGCDWRWENSNILTAGTALILYGRFIRLSDF